MSSTRVRFGTFIAVGLLVAIAIAALVSPQASTQPDGLVKVASDTGLSTSERPHPLSDSPTAGYMVHNVRNRRLSKGMAGALGVTATFALGGGVVLALRRFRPPRPSTNSTG